MIPVVPMLKPGTLCQLIDATQARFRRLVVLEPNRVSFSTTTDDKDIVCGRRVLKHWAPNSFGLYLSTERDEVYDNVHLHKIIYDDTIGFIIDRQVQLLEVK